MTDRGGRDAKIRWLAQVEACATKKKNAGKDAGATRNKKAPRRAGRTTLPGAFYQRHDCPVKKKISEVFVMGWRGSDGSSEKRLRPKESVEHFRAPAGGLKLSL